MVGLAKIYGQFYLIPAVKITYTRKLNGNLEFILAWFNFEIYLYI